MHKASAENPKYEIAFWSSINAGKNGTKTLRERERHREREREREREMLAKLARLLRRRELIGTDKAGNCYYLHNEKIEGALVEKRWVEFKDGPDPKTIPVEWTSWLAGTRNIAPTPEEMSQLEEQRRLIKVKALFLEKEEEKRRFRAKSLQHISPDVSSPQSMEMLFQQIGNINPQAGDQSPLLNDAAASQKTDSSKDAEPSSRTSEPVGHGDTFIPGTWRPS
ncbi:hypothetical protein O6H91_04G113000 [Diphasiastrum complanatum]|uniref:Uncharacterized protein n=1 Tax=Diphasiastrum complanatum TaxID=34168 RepID=A0ACC2E154_DIPCM|nr:hypothetical protein O6H91_04G113000 [Diphasiastrum complanatum]